MAEVLVVYHSLSGNTRAAAEAVAEGASSVEGVEVRLLEALQAGPDDLVRCDTLGVGTPDFFSYMAGGLKDFFDRTFYPTQGRVTDKPVGIFVTHGGGGKAVESVKAICRTFKFRLACEPVLVQSRPDEKAAKRLREMGALLGRLAGQGQ